MQKSFFPTRKNRNFSISIINSQDAACRRQYLPGKSGGISNKGKYWPEHEALVPHSPVDEKHAIKASEALISSSNNPVASYGSKINKQFEDIRSAGFESG